MIVTGRAYSSQVRDRLDWAEILAAGPGEVRFGRGLGGSYTAEVIVLGAKASASDRTEPMRAFRAALRDLRPEIVSVLRG